MSSALALLNLLAEGGHTGFWSYSDNTKTFFADAAACQLLGCSASPVSSLTDLLAAVDASARVELQHEVQQAITRRSSFYREFRLAGRRNRLSMRGRWSARADSAEGAFICVVERVLSLGAPERTHLRFSLMMASNVVGIFIAGPDGEIFEANDYFLNMLGLERQALEAGQLNWQTLTAPHTMDLTLRSVQQMTLRGGSLPYEKEYLHADGRRIPALVALSQLSAEPVRGIVIVLDISDLKSTQSELLIRNAQLLERSQAAERAEAAKTLFLSSVSHELRTPLHTMLGHVSLMRKNASGEELQQLCVVERSSMHLLRLIEDLLEYSHSTIAPEQLEPELVVLEGYLHSLRLIGDAATANTDNQFFIQLGAALPTAMVVDEGRLTQVLRILMDNACKYTRAGVVIFSLSLEGPQAQRSKLRFSVEDNGRGMDSADVDHVFEPLKRGSNTADIHGLGLGLAIAAQWITRMGSRIAVQSTRGIGSNFSFVLDLELSFEAVTHSRPLQHLPAFSPNIPRAAMALQPLPEQDLHNLGELIRMGRLGRLQDWAKALEKRCPQNQEAATLVGELAGNADLDALEALHGRWVALGCDSEARQRED